MKQGSIAVLAGVTGVLVAGCGTGAHTVHRAPARTEVFESGAQVVSLERFVRRSIGGTSFLAPARLDPGMVDLIHPGAINVDLHFAPRSTPPGIDASTAHVIERPDHVEVLATGPAGMPVDIFWEETCGSHLIGKGPGEQGGRGGQGEARARLPAVLAVTLPRWSTDEDSCYVTSTLLTNRFQRGLAVELVNY